MNKNKFLIGTILGAAVGAVTGLLTAPKSGQETREEIKAKAKEFREETIRKAEAPEEPRIPINSLKKQAKGTLERGKELSKKIR